MKPTRDFRGGALDGPSSGYLPAAAVDLGARHGAGLAWCRERLPVCRAAIVLTNSPQIGAVLPHGPVITRGAES